VKVIKEPRQAAPESNEKDVTMAGVTSAMEEAALGWRSSVARDRMNVVCASLRDGKHIPEPLIQSDAGPVGRISIEDANTLP